MDAAVLREHLSRLDAALTEPARRADKLSVQGRRMSDTVTRPIREDLLRDPRRPVHKIADRLLLYLRVLVDQFHPDEVILFGSYAYGRPADHSDVDLLVVKAMQASGIREANAILRAWRPVRRTMGTLPIELIVESPERHRSRASGQGSFYSEIVRRGVRLV